MGRILKSAAFAAAAFLLPALEADAQSLSPAQEARYTIQIVGWVPVICRATLNQDMVSEDEGVVDLGDLQEFCNDAGGYQVWIDSTPGAGGILYVDGQEIPLSQSGATLISTSPTAAKRARHLALDTGQGGSAPASLSIRVVAL